MHRPALSCNNDTSESTYGFECCAAGVTDEVLQHYLQIADIGLERTTGFEPVHMTGLAIALPLSLPRVKRKPDRQPIGINNGMYLGCQPTACPRFPPYPSD